MSHISLTHARHTGRTARPVLAVAECMGAARAFYFGYWFSQRRR